MKEIPSDNAYFSPPTSICEDIWYQRDQTLVPVEMKGNAGNNMDMSTISARKTTIIGRDPKSN